MIGTRPAAKGDSMLEITGIFLGLWLASAQVVQDGGESVEAATSPSPSPAEKNAEIQSIRRALAKSFSVKGAFLLDIQCNGSGPSPMFTGTFEVKRRGRYRFQYISPPGKLMISDGTASYVYDKVAGTVILSTETDAVFRALGGMLLGEGDADFAVEKMRGPKAEGDGWTVLRFTPTTPEPLFSQLWMTLSDEPPFIRRVIVVDAGGCIIRTTFSNVQFDTGIKDRRFQFTPPKNAAVVSP